MVIECKLISNLKKKTADRWVNKDKNLNRKVNRIKCVIITYMLYLAPYCKNRNWLRVVELLKVPLVM